MSWLPGCMIWKSCEEIDGASPVSVCDTIAAHCSCNLTRLYAHQLVEGANTLLVAGFCSGAQVLSQRYRRLNWKLAARCKSSPVV